MKKQNFGAVNRESASRLTGGSRLNLGIRETPPTAKTPAPRNEMGAVKRVMAGKPDTARGKK